MDGFPGCLLWAVVRDNTVPMMKSLTSCESETRHTPHKDPDSLLS